MVIKTRINYTQQSKRNITAKGECNGEARAHALKKKKATVFTSKLCTKKKKKRKKKGRSDQSIWKTITTKVTV